MRILVAFCTLSLLLVPGQNPNRVMDLDGASQYAITVVIGGFNPNEISVEAWVRPEAPLPGAGPRTTRIVQKGSEGTQALPDGRFSLRYAEDDTPGAPTGIVSFVVFLGSFIPNDEAVVTAPAPIATDEWTHVCGTFSSITGMATLYINGLAVATTATSSGGMPLIGQPMTRTPQPIGIGAIPFWSPASAGTRSVPIASSQLCVQPANSRAPSGLRSWSS